MFRGAVTKLWNLEFLNFMLNSVILLIINRGDIEDHEHNECEFRPEVSLRVVVKFFKLKSHMHVCVIIKKIAKNVGKLK